MTLTSAGGRLHKARLHGQLLHRRAGSGRGHALYRAVHGSGCWLCAGAVGGCHLCDFYGAGAGPRRALCGADAATGLDALAAASPAYGWRFCVRPSPCRSSPRLSGWPGYWQAYGAGALAALLGSFLLLAIAGWFLGRWPARRWATAIAALILLGVIALTVFSQRLVSDSADAASQPSSSTTAASAWQPWSAEAVSRYQVQGRPVFVDFTASWCLSCQVNERVALNQPEVQRAFADRKVVLLRADWTRHDEAITQALTALGRSGVPAYALYPPGKRVPSSFRKCSRRES